MVNVSSISKAFGVIAVVMLVLSSSGCLDFFGIKTMDDVSGDEVWNYDVSYSDTRVRTTPIEMDDSTGYYHFTFAGRELVGGLTYKLIVTLSIEEGNYKIITSPNSDYSSGQLGIKVDEPASGEWGSAGYEYQKTVSFLIVFSGGELVDPEELPWTLTEESCQGQLQLTVRYDGHNDEVIINEFIDIVYVGSDVVLEDGPIEVS